MHAHLDDDTPPAERIARLESQGEKHLVQVDGRRVAWHRFGSGPPLVLVHGGHGSWLHWVRNIEPLACRFTVWVPDLPGYGESGAAASIELAGVVEPAIASLDSLVGAGTAIDLVGFSFGGLVAAQLAAQRRHVRRLALLGPAGHGGRRRPRGKLVNWKAAAAAHDAAALAAAMRYNLAIHMLHDPARIDALAVQVHTDSCIRTRFRSKTISYTRNLGETLDAARVEPLLIWGEHDVTAEPAVAIESLTANRPGRRAQIVHGAGHWVQYEGADEVNRLLLDCLDG